MSMVAAIKIEQKKAGMTDAEYRKMLHQIAGVSSARDLDEDGGKAVLKALRTRVASLSRQSFKAPQTAQERKIWAMWYELRDLLPKEERTYAYLLGICRRAADAREIGSIGELDPKQMHKAIEALKIKLNQTEPQPTDEVPF